jgi:hypothetical protein
MLSVVAGLPSFFFDWWSLSGFHGNSTLSLVYQFTEGVTAVAIGVFFPFAVMLILSRGVSSKLVLLGITVSTFLGCWVGSSVSFSLASFLVPVLVGAEFTSILSTVLDIFYMLVTEAFSLVFFVSWSAILFSFYRNNFEKPARAPQTTEDRGVIL